MEEFITQLKNGATMADAPLLVQQALAQDFFDATIFFCVVFGTAIILFFLSRSGLKQYYETGKDDFAAQFFMCGIVCIGAFLTSLFPLRHMYQIKYTPEKYVVEHYDTQDE